MSRELLTGHVSAALSVATPYRENAVCAIARSAATRGDLARFYTTLYFPPLGRELERRSFAGIPGERIRTAARGIELVHVLSRRLMAKRAPLLPNALMYRVKACFDRAVARLLQRGAPAAFVGMYAAAAESLRAVKRQGGRAALNFVNSHPAEHNRHLRELGGVRGSHHELIPQWVERRVALELERADVVLVPSRFVASQMRAHGVPSERVAVVPYGVDLSAFRPRDEQYELRNGAHSPRGRLVGLYVGHICHGKGLSALLEAARLCRRLPVSFRLVGPIVSREVLHDVPDNVRYEGLLHPAAVPDAMRRADFFVLPTLDDSFGLVVLEAMASGLPVITTRHAGAAEYIDDGADGLVVAPGDARALATAIARLVEDAPARRRLAEAALLKVRSSGSWEAYGQRVLDLVVP